MPILKDVEDKVNRQPQLRASRRSLKLSLTASRILGYHLSVAIENRPLKSGRPKAGSALWALSQSKGGNVCRRHYLGPVAQLDRAPGSYLEDASSTLAGASKNTPEGCLNIPQAKIRATEAAQTFQIHYPAFGCASQGENSRDLPQLPD